MFNIKSRWARAKSLISIKTYKRPLLYLIMMMLLINVVVLLIAAWIARLIDDSFTSYIDALANGSVKWLLSPNAILEIDQPQTLALAVTVLLIGLVLFSGTIIALITNAIKEFIQKKKEGSGKIILDQHIVILNWNSKVPELVSDLLYVESQDVTLMILADIDKGYAEKQIINAIQHSRKDQDIIHLNVLVKKGDPLMPSDLEDISISHAKAILIMNPESYLHVHDQMTQSDLMVIKTILTLGPIPFVYHPPIVVEIKHYETKEQIMTLSKAVPSLHEHNIMPICFDKRLGQIIAQTLIEHHIEDVYLSLFSFKGLEVYAMKKPSIDDILKDHAYAIPVGKDKETVFVLAMNDAIKHKTSTHAYPIKQLKVQPLDKKRDMVIYIIGKNNKLSFIMDAFARYESMHGSSFVANAVAEDRLAELVDTINTSEKPATILLLSDEHQKAEALDANVIHHLIYLEGHLKDKHHHIVVELLNPNNDHIVRGFSIENTIISNKIISLLLSKLALFKETSLFYENLLTIAKDVDNKDRQSITLHDAVRLFDMNFPIVFESKKQCIESIYQAFDRQVIPIGYFKGSILQMFEGDLHEASLVSFDPTDQIILMTL